MEVVRDTGVACTHAYIHLGIAIKIINNASAIKSYITTISFRRIRQSCYGNQSSLLAPALTLEQKAAPRSPDQSLAVLHKLAELRGGDRRDGLGGQARCLRTERHHLVANEPQVRWEPVPCG